jgi:hypothetical protein
VAAPAEIVPAHRALQGTVDQGVLQWDVAAMTMTMMAREANVLRWRVAAPNDVALRNLVNVAVSVECKLDAVVQRVRIVVALVAVANIADRCLPVAVEADRKPCATMADITAGMVTWDAADSPDAGTVKCMVAADTVAVNMDMASLAVEIIADTAASTAM